MSSADYFVSLYQRLTTASSTAPCPEDVIELDSFDPDSPAPPRRVTLTAIPLEPSESPTTLSASLREDTRALTREGAQGGDQDSSSPISSPAGEERSYLTFLEEVQARDESKAHQAQTDKRRGEPKSDSKGSKKRARSAKSPKGASPQSKRKSSKHKDQPHREQPHRDQPETPQPTPHVKTGDARPPKSAPKGQRRRRSRAKGKE